MSDPPTVLDYARPPRRQSPWTQTEAWLALLANGTLGFLALGERIHWWANLQGLAAGFFIVSFALILTVTCIAAFGVLTAYIDGPTTRSRQWLAWKVLGITAVNCAAFVSVVALVVARVL